MLRVENMRPDQAEMKKEWEHLQVTVQVLHSQFLVAMAEVKGVVQRIKDSTFRITKIVAKVNARQLADGKSIKFYIEAIKDK